MNQHTLRRACAAWIVSTFAPAIALTHGMALAGEADFLSDTRQLVFEGRRSGEGYFSADGKEIVFQSEREAGNPFYQIYALNLDSGDSERISPGVGKTTCAWFSPDRSKVLFASTQDDPDAKKKQQEELDFRASGKQKRYAWDYDEHFELYAFDRKSKQYARLTNVRGYDAEGSYSPDGSKIAFTSNRLAYERLSKMSAAEKQQLETDPSLFCDLFIMNADGTDCRPLTTKLGYDGGPFFSPDGKRVCFRRFDENGAIAEVYTIGIDGRDERQLTKLGAMSWAPFYHPSGEYLIFTTNRHGFANFELYIVGVDGGEPIRVSHTEGFDGLPVFTPDGKRLAWTTSRTADKSAQIFIANWNHEAARAAIRDGKDRVAVLDALIAKHAKTPTTREITVEDIRQRVAILADEATEGRMTGSRGEWLSTEYVAREFARLGLAPGGDNGTYFQEFQFSAGVKLEADNRLEASWPEATGDAPAPKSFVLDRDWRPLAFSANAAVPPSEIVFGGYGVVAPAEGDQPAYDSFKGLDVSGKWLLVLRYLPEDVSDARRQQLRRYGGLRYKAMLARDRGAKGLIIVTGPDVKVKSELVPLDADASMARGTLPIVSISNEAADALLSPAGAPLATMMKGIGANGEVSGNAVAGVRLAANVALASEMRRGRNVVGVSTPIKGNNGAPIVIGAHVDHLGRGHSGNSLARDEEKDGIHFGADDNASGVAGMLEMAEHLLPVPGENSGAASRSGPWVFVAWSGEELGLIGSKHFVEQIEDKAQSAIPRDRVHCYINLDMVGRLSEKLMLAGVGSSPVWKREIEKRNAVVGLSLALQDDGYLPTDATSFYLKGVPVLSAFTGSHAEYHTPRDTPEKLNYEGAQKTTKLLALIANGIDRDRDGNGTPMEFIPPSKSAPAMASGARAALRAYLGTIPDYAPMDKPGLKLNGVASGGPAHAAGVRGGDIIIELAGKKIENIHDYTYILDALKVGEKTKIVVLRGDQRVEMEMVPGSRE